MNLWILIHFYVTKLFYVIYSEKIVFLIAQLYTLHGKFEEHRTLNLLIWISLFQLNLGLYNIEKTSAVLSKYNKTDAS